MSKCVNADLLKDGMTELYDRRKISSDVKKSMDEYINSISTTNVLEIKYSDYNQLDSKNVIFNDNTRSVSYDTGNSELLTNKINLASVELEALKIQATDENIQFQISHNGTTWYNINSYNINEVIEEDGFYLKILFTQSNTINNILIIYK